MMKYQQITPSSLRSASERSSKHIYDEYKIKLLSVVARLSSFDPNSPVSISTLKDYMNITYSALAKIITQLKQEGLITLEIDPHSPIEDELIVKISPMGLSLLANQPDL